MNKAWDAMYRIECEVLEGGKLPSKARQTDAGFDVYATQDITLYPGQVLKHPLNIRFKLPHGTWGEITTKSGLGSKGQLVWAGVIDEEYRGIPHVIMTNVNLTHHIEMQEEMAGFNLANPVPVLVSNREPIVIKKGEKIAQFIMSPYSPNFHVVQVDKVDTNTSRGEGGFGSTGR